MAVNQFVDWSVQQTRTQENDHIVRKFNAKITKEKYTELFYKRRNTAMLIKQTKAIQHFTFTDFYAIMAFIYFFNTL